MLAQAVHGVESGEKPDYRSQAQEVSQYIQKTYFDESTGLYRESTETRDPCFVWPGGVQFSALVAAARHDSPTYRPLMDKYFVALDRYWDRRAKLPGYEPAPIRGRAAGDKYYDDNAWMVLTFLEAYDLTQDKRYLERAEATLAFVLSAWDDKLDGGLWWHEQHKDDSKNTCINAPAAVACLRMSQYSSKPAYYLDWTKKLNDWTKKKLQDADGLYFDRVIVGNGKVHKGKLTYNTALMLRAALGLHRQGRLPEQLDEAKRLAQASQFFISERTGAYRDASKWSHLLIEADLELYRATKEVYLLDRARRNGDYLYAQFKKTPPKELINAAGTARTLWLLADVDSKAGQAFWEKVERTK